MNVTVSDKDIQWRLMRLCIAVGTGGLAVALATVIAVLGHDYYRLPRAERPFHIYHHLLSPSGWAGLVFGISATVLFALNLAYLVRKRLINVRGLGSLRTWMSFHVVTGLIGGVLVPLHAAFAPSSALGVLALVALAITVITGIVGRYIYAMVPRSLEGRELEIEQVRERLQTYRGQLETAGVGVEWLLLPLQQEEFDHPRSIPGGFMMMLRGDQQSRRDYRRLRRAILTSPDLRRSAREILPLARAFCRYRHWLIRYHELRNLLASWRFLHRWLAIVMLAVMAFHIGLAVRFGDLWIMGGMP